MKVEKDLKEYRSLSQEEMSKRLFETSDELMKTRFNKMNGQLQNVKQINALRKNVARMKTILAETKAKAVN